MTVERIVEDLPQLAEKVIRDLEGKHSLNKFSTNDFAEYKNLIEQSAKLRNQTIIFFLLVIVILFLFIKY